MMPPALYAPGPTNPSMCRWLWCPGASTVSGATVLVATGGGFVGTAVAFEPPDPGVLDGPAVACGALVDVAAGADVGFAPAKDVAVGFGNEPTPPLPPAPPPVPPAPDGTMPMLGPDPVRVVAVGGAAVGLPL